MSLNPIVLAHLLAHSRLSKTGWLLAIGKKKMFMRLLGLIPFTRRINLNKKLSTEIEHTKFRQSEAKYFLEDEGFP